jgi:hypothetical protein
LWRRGIWPVSRSLHREGGTVHIKGASESFLPSMGEMRAPSSRMRMLQCTGKGRGRERGVLFDDLQTEEGKRLQESSLLDGVLDSCYKKSSFYRYRREKMRPYPTFLFRGSRVFPAPPAAAVGGLSAWGGGGGGGRLVWPFLEPNIFQEKVGRSRDFPRPPLFSRRCSHVEVMVAEPIHEEGIRILSGGPVCGLVLSRRSPR